MSLGFEGLATKENRIAGPFKDTCSWILKAPCKSPSHLQDQASHKRKFQSWLSGDDMGQAFWISGKPGSGKSTLMSKLLWSTTTHDALKQWSSPDKLITARFFFDGTDTSVFTNWAFSTTEQTQNEDVLKMTREGMVRSLLLQILQQRKDLAEVALGRIIQVDLRSVGQVKALGWATLRHVLQAVLRNMGTSKLFLLIDGLDEYRSLHSACDFIRRDSKKPNSEFEDDGDLGYSAWISHGHLEIAEMLRDILATTANVKLCFTSREVPIFETEFDEFPRIHIQEHTRESIKQYCVGRLEGARDLSTDQISRYTERITAQARGMFLWVRLVVDKLLQSHSRGLSPDELERVIYAFPSRLATQSSVYTDMWRAISPQDLRQAIQLMVLVHFTRTRELFLDLLTLHFAQEGCKQQPSTQVIVALQDDFRPRSKHELWPKRRRLKKHLMAVCMGFLEVTNEVEDGPDEVHFMHMTAQQYLSTVTADKRTYTWEAESMRLSGVGVCLDVMSGYVRRLKCCKEIIHVENVTRTCDENHAAEIPRLHKPWAGMIESFLNLASTIDRRMTDAYVGTYISLVDELDKTMRQHYKSLVGRLDLLPTNLEDFEASWPMWYDAVEIHPIKGFHRRSTFIHLAVESDLITYLKSKDIGHLNLKDE